jgi:hypothetical protein
MANKKTLSKFTQKVIDMNFTDDSFESQVESFRKKSVIECNTQITLLQTSSLPLLLLSKEEIERNIEEAKTAKDKAMYTIADSFENYINSINQCSSKIADLEEELEGISEKIEYIESQIKMYEKIKEILEEK